MLGENDHVTWAARLLATARGEVGAAPAWRRVRDLALFDLAPGVSLVLACDSVGGIGPKPHDRYETSGYVLGRLAARVPLAELLACGATPLFVLDMLTVERDPTGTAIIAGIRDEMRAIGLSPEALNGSTEENVPTLSSGVGIAVVGLVAAERFRPGRARSGDLLALVGVPKSAPRRRVAADDPETLDLAALRRVLACPGTGDVLPVGSRGVIAEAHDLAAFAGLQFAPDPACPLDLDASGGPATCCLVALPPDALSTLRTLPGLPPVTVVGTLQSGN